MTCVTVRFRAARWMLAFAAAPAALTHGCEGVDGSADADVKSSDAGLSDTGSSATEGGDGASRDEAFRSSEGSPSTDRDQEIPDANLSDATDGSCACVPIDAVEATVPLACFCRDLCESSYQDLVGDPCTPVRVTFGGPYLYVGRVSSINYENCGLVGLEVQRIDFPTYIYFYDATTKALVGAERFGIGMATPGIVPNSILCPTTTTGGLGTITIRAGVTPDCAATQTRVLCPPPDGGVDASSDR